MFLLGQVVGDDLDAFRVSCSRSCFLEERFPIFVFCGVFSQVS